MLLLAFEGGGYDAVIRAQVGVVISGLLALGLALGVLPRARLSSAAVLALLGFAGLTLLIALAFRWTESDERTYGELARVIQLGGVVLLAYLGLNRSTWQGAAAGIATAALIVPLFAVASRLFPEVIGDDVTRAFESDRLSYPLDYWNGVACWGAMAIAIALALSAHLERSALRSIALAAVPFAALSVYLSYSRAGAIAVPLAVVITIALSRHRWTAGANAVAAGAASSAVILVARSQDEIARATGGAGSGIVLAALALAALACAAAAYLSGRFGFDRLRMARRRAQWVLAGCAVATAVAAGVLHGPLDRAWRDFKNERAIAQGSEPTARLSSLGGKRYVVWSAAADAFGDDPARGIGPGSFEFYWSRQGDDPEFVRDAHSLYLEVLAELGVPGLVALLIGLGGLLAAALAARRSSRRSRDTGGVVATVSAYIVFLFYAGVDWMWELASVATLALAAIAIAGAAAFERRRVRLALPVRIAGVAAAALMLAVQVPVLTSTERIRAARDALVAGEYGEAAQLADEAVEAEPWAASPYARRALVAEARGKLATARADLQEAMEREPTNWRHHLLLARVEARQGDRRGVKRELKEVRRLAPESPFLYRFNPFRIEIGRLLRASDR